MSGPFVDVHQTCHSVNVHVLHDVGQSGQPAIKLVVNVLVVTVRSSILEQTFSSCSSESDKLFSWFTILSWHSACPSQHQYTEMGCGMACMYRDMFVFCCPGSHLCQNGMAPYDDTHISVI